MFKTVKLEWLLFQFRLIPKFLSLIWFATQATLWNYFLYLWPKDKNIFIRPFCSLDKSRTQGFLDWSAILVRLRFGGCSRLPWIMLIPELFKIVGDIGIIRNDFQGWFHSIIKLWVVFIWVWNLKIPGIQPRHANLAYVRRFEWVLAEPQINAINFTPRTFVIFHSILHRMEKMTQLINRSA